MILVPAAAVKSTKNAVENKVINKQDKYKGLLLKESLKDESVLELVTVTRTEVWDVKNAAEFQPKQWTAISFEGDRDKMDGVAEQFSCVLKPKWYLNMSDKKYEIVIFSEKIFKYFKKDTEKKNEAIQYGKTIGIPPHQLDW